MPFLKDFKAFALKGNVIDLAVAVVIGAAFTKIVTAVVDDLIMPLVNGVVPGGSWRTWTVSPLKLQLGHLIGAVLDFLIVALIMFIVVVKLINRNKKEAPPATKQCPECLETIPAAARRCKACASAIAA